MATSPRKSRPALVLLSFLAAIGLLFGIMAGTHTWTPKLGLDLKGGMTITLTATNDVVSPDSLELAKNIMQQRVDGMGVGEATVSVSGDRNIIVSAPNVQRDDLVELVGATAQLSFRQVLATSAADGAGTATSPTAMTGFPPAPSRDMTGFPAPQASPSPTPSVEASAAPSEGTRLPISDVLAYTETAEDTAALQAYQCGGETADVLDKTMVACDETGAFKYLLGPVAIRGTQVTDAQSGVNPQGVGNVVTLRVDDEGTAQLTQLTSSLYSQTAPKNQFAIVLDGIVQSAPSVNEPITAGSAQISGTFTADSAAGLANVLKFGALPLDFDASQVENVSATLGGEQLRVGLIAGLIGLLVVAAYCLAYYRGLGSVVIGSLVVAAAATYASMVILGQAMGFALSLPAIAGAIVAIGVTADSFIIYFERIRDEIREGRSLRSAISTGWQKARSTIVVADLVSILSAVVLYLLAVGGVKGFAFTLGLTTLIDLAVCFFFTKPLVQLLGNTKFFGEGHKWSGLDASHMGVSRDSLLGRRTRRTTRTVKEA